MTETATLAGGCFWGVEELIRKLPGVVDTSVGYAGGTLDNPRYEDVKTGRTGHAESVEIVFDPEKISYDDILDFFFRLHDPTTTNRQGNDVGTQYRSAILFQGEDQQRQAEESLATYQRMLSASGHGQITTEVAPAGPFYYAEAYHQQYLAPTKNPGGYCGLGGTGVSCPIGLTA